MKFSSRYLLLMNQFLLQYRWLLLSVFVNLIVHFIVAIIYFNPVDFVLQVETAREIAKGNLLYRDIHQIVYGDVFFPKAQYPPLYLYTLAILVFSIGVGSFTFEMAKFFLIIVNFLVAFVIYYLTSMYLDKKYALLSFNWFLLNPSTIGVVLGGYHENFLLLFILLGYFFLFRYQYTLSGITFGLALLVKPIAGICMLPLIIWGLKKKNLSSLKIWFFSGATFVLISSPFLFLAPTEFINDVFLIHTHRLNPSMSFYNYILVDLSPTLFPFVIQLIIFLGLGIILYKRVQFEYPIELLMIVLPFTTIFLASNRILYPHYIPFIFPFFTLHFFYSINKYSLNSKNHDSLKHIKIDLMGLVVVYIGAIWWSVLWIIESYQTYLTNLLFPLSASICIIGLLIITGSSLSYIISKNSN